MKDIDISELVDDLNYKIWENTSVEKAGHYFSYLSYTNGQCILFGKHILWDSDHDWFENRRDLEKHLLDIFKDYVLDLVLINSLLNGK